MATRIPTATRNAMVKAVADKVDAGSGPGYIDVFSGAQPATANDAETGTKLVTFTLHDPAFGAPATGVVTLDVSTAVEAFPIANGTAGWFRLKDSDGNTVLDGSCGTSGQQLNLTTTALDTTVKVAIASGTITAPAS